MVTRRSVLRAGVLGSLAAAGAVSTAVRAAAPAHAAGTNLIGYTAKGTYSCEQLDALTGRTARVVRHYHVQGRPLPTSLAEAGLLTYLRDENRSVVYSLKVPDSSTDSYDACAALGADIAANGYTGRIWVIIWHEPFPELSASAYVNRYRAVAPALRAHGIRCGPCFHTYPIWHKGLDYTEYWPGDDVADFLGIDTYPMDTLKADKLSANPLGTIAPLTSFAKGRGKTFGIAEFGIDADLAAAQPDQAAAWIGHFERLGSSCRFATYWNGGNCGLQLNDGLLVPAYQSLYDRFS